MLRSSSPLRLLALLLLVPALLLTSAGSAPALDLTITAANVVQDATVTVKMSGTAGEAITAGSPIYIKAADGKLYNALSSGTTAQATIVGIAISTGVSGQPMFYHNSGLITIGATVAVGEIYVLSKNSGKIAPCGDLATGNYVSVIGVGVSATQINYLPYISGIAHY